MTPDAHENSFRERAARSETRGSFLLLVAGCI
ncbi:hypothetical protein JOF58_000779 [Streptomyces cinnamonensis]|nr:hypothetical protein [Streptomyces virginiae]